MAVINASLKMIQTVCNMANNVQGASINTSDNIKIETNTPASGYTQITFFEAGTTNAVVQVIFDDDKI